MTSFNGLCSAAEGLERSSLPRRQRAATVALQPAGGLRHSHRQAQMAPRRPGRPARPAASRTFFLGPPLPLMGQLYVLGEIKGEIRLLALEAPRATFSGRSNWRWRSKRASRPVAPLGGGVALLRRRHSGLPHLDRRHCGRRPGHAIALVGILLRPGRDRQRPNFGMAMFLADQSAAAAGSTAASRSPTAACWPRRSNPTCSTA